MDQPITKMTKHSSKTVIKTMVKRHKGKNKIEPAPRWRRCPLPHPLIHRMVCYDSSLLFPGSQVIQSLVEAVPHVGVRNILFPIHHPPSVPPQFHRHGVHLVRRPYVHAETMWGIPSLHLLTPLHLEPIPASHRRSLPQ